MADQDANAASNDDEFLDRFNNLAESVGKLLISLSAGTVVVSVTFVRDFAPESGATHVKWALKLGWTMEPAAQAYDVERSTWLKTLNTTIED